MSEPVVELTDSVPVPDPTPSPDAPAPDAVPSPDVPADDKPADAPAADVPADAPPSDQLYELPDGRKVDAATLQKEWKENFAPEFTRRSQRLAEYEKVGKPDPINNEPEWKKPDYVPKSYAEVIEIATAEAETRLAAKAQSAQQQEAAIAAKIDAQITDLKKSDPTLDENALFQHANKYGFTDLKVAHTNMTEMKKAVVDTEQRVLKNLKTREADPVSGGPGGQAIATDEYDPTSMSHFSSAVEFFQSLKK